MATAPKSKRSFDQLVELLKREVDITLLIENLKLTPEERVKKLNSFMQLVDEATAAGRRIKGKQ